MTYSVPNIIAYSGADVCEWQLFTKDSNTMIFIWKLLRYSSWKHVVFHGHSWLYAHCLITWLSFKCIPWIICTVYTLLYFVMVWTYSTSNISSKVISLELGQAYCCRTLPWITWKLQQPLKNPNRTTLKQNVQNMRIFYGECCIYPRKNNIRRKQHESIPFSKIIR